MPTLAECLLVIVVDCQRDIKQLGEQDDLIDLHNEAVDLFNNLIGGEEQ